MGKTFAGRGVRIELVLGRHVAVLAFPGDQGRCGLAPAWWRGWNLENPGELVCERRGGFAVDQLERRRQRCAVALKGSPTSSYSSSCSGVSSLWAAQGALRRDRRRSGGPYSLVVVVGSVDGSVVLVHSG